MNTSRPRVGWAVIGLLAACAHDSSARPRDVGADPSAARERSALALEESLVQRYVPRDPTTFRVTLERNSGCCGGKGPAFSLSLTGDGAVDFVGTANVSELGHRRSSIPPIGLRALYEEFARTDFFSLKGEYGMAWIGPPDSILTLELDGRSKRVTNRWRPGMKDGEPTQLQDQLWALSEVVIQTAGVEAWISR